MTSKSIHFETSTSAYDRIGKLRPWETRELAKEYADSAKAAIFAKGLRDHVLLSFSENISADHAEDILLIATDARSILKDNVDLIVENLDQSLAARALAAAINGSSLIDLEDMIINNATTSPRSNDIQMVATIVESYISKNHIRANELPSLIFEVHKSLSSLSNPEKDASVSEKHEGPTPSQIKDSVTREGLFSFIDGKIYKTLKRHLKTHGFTPESYKERFGLPDDYPMVAASYSETRSALSTALGSGRPGHQRSRLQQPRQHARQHASRHRRGEAAE